MAKDKVTKFACSCGQELGDAAKTFPFFDGEKAICPVCADSKYIGKFGRAVACTRCGFKTLSQGVKRACGACSFPHVSELCPS